MGSTGYLTCGICWMCGKCYPREATCPQCGAPVNLDDDRCACCSRVIGDADRLEARDRFMAAKKLEASRDFPRAGRRSMTAPSVPVPTMRK